MARVLPCKFLPFFPMLFDSLIIPVKDTISKDDVASCELQVVAVKALSGFFLVAEEVVNTIKTSLGVHEVYQGHYEQTHGHSDKVKHGEHCINLSRCD